MQTLTEIEAITPHVAEKIEVGAILYSSWGYEQTNIDFYLVVRTTASSCWILPMDSHEEPGQAYDTGYASPLQARTHSDECTLCEHRSRHSAIDGCSRCDCQTAEYAPLEPRRHKIVRYGSSEGINLNSFSGAYLWDGKAKYASHYA
jgi:hypothetical protein